MNEPVQCRCGAKESHIIREVRPDRWTCYCNSCGRNDAEGYGTTRAGAISDFNRRVTTGKTAAHGRASTQATPVKRPDTVRGADGSSPSCLHHLTTGDRENE